MVVKENSQLHARINILLLEMYLTSICV